MSFYERLDGLLKLKNISQRRMIIDLGLNKNTMFNWKHRNNIPSGEVLLWLSEYLDVSVDYLLCNDKYCINAKGVTSDMESVFNSEQLIGNITELCAEKNISAECMLRECGLSGSIMNDLAKGFDPPLGKIVVIADFLGVTVDSLINGKFTNERKNENEIL